MSAPITVEAATRAPAHLRLGALVAVGIARVLARQSPRRLRRALERASRGGRPATADEALRARNAVVSVSMRCRGHWCLQRSIATALLCRSGGSWPQWCSGVRVQPFLAHAWVAVDGVPVGERHVDLQDFHLTLAVPRRQARPRAGDRDL
ncbi:hypothetical protein CFN78_12395 [Amycolatopsis antarctica]|uniref:Microcin J25-processing protein McjB C-terminal domain-containing protein n=1 Tax=Amycolatopsis antarctica TaxID=1854586 RepID=A0A263D3I5_9PSEU|nr:lasso peptide biosynthesis B2 protein [Amycolatopsis antarctica]OZM73023.1 hypothetical protein CFN78_12395 [Amycolatopsis antarctica]